MFLNTSRLIGSTGIATPNIQTLRKHNTTAEWPTDGSLVRSRVIAVLIRRLAVPRAMLQGGLDRPNGIGVGEVRLLRGLARIQAHLGEGKVCWNRMSIAEFLSESAVDDA